MVLFSGLLRAYCYFFWRLQEHTFKKGLNHGLNQKAPHIRIEQCKIGRFWPWILVGLIQSMVLEV